MLLSLLLAIPLLGIFIISTSMSYELTSSSIKRIKTIASILIPILIIGQEIYNYCSYNHVKNFSIDIDSITIGILLCNIPHISEHWP